MECVDDTECLWDEDAEDPPSQQSLSVEEELEVFRRRWQQELHQGAALRESSGSPERSLEEPSIEEQAKYLFLQGVSAEQSGRLYDAIRYYRRAVQLVPDIEFRIEDYKPRRRKDRQDSESSIGSSSEVEVEDLIQHFVNLKTNDERMICEPTTEIGNAGHFSKLPFEILMYIFKWVVSSDLDLVSLVRLSEVCRGFFVCARDEELWKLICQRVYGKKCGRPGIYGSYRNMYIEKTHLRYNGCYISRQEYFRQGEKSLDGFYQPYHMVEYYRYVRFFPDGQILMLTSPENPYQEVPKLRNVNARIQGILHGYYKMQGDMVTALMKRRTVIEYTPFYYRYKSRARQNQNNNEAEQSFQVEFLLRNAGKRTCSQLVWNQYSVHTIYRASGQEQTADFELTNNNYPPMIFSRVKSYTSSSERPLK